MASKRKRAAIICESCYEDEDFDDMVNCGKCLKWSHFCCASVGPKIKHHDWQCDVCKAAEMAAIQEDVKNIKMGQSKIAKTVTASVTYTEAVQGDVKNIKLGQDEIIKSVAASLTFAKTFEKEVKHLKSDHNETKGAISELKLGLKEIKETMKVVKTETKRESTPPNRMSMLPSKTLKELQDLLTHVGSDAGYSQFKLYVSALCGSDIKKSIRNILLNVMSADVLKLLSWSGYRTTKPSFEKGYKRIVDCISETLHEKFKDYNYDVLQKKASTVFK